MQTQNGKNDLKVEYYDPAERARQKQLAREQDDEDLRTGRVTREELSRRNGFFSSLDFSKATIIFPKS